MINKIIQMEVVAVQEILIVHNINKEIKKILPLEIQNQMELRAKNQVKHKEDGQKKSMRNSRRVYSYLGEIGREWKSI